MPLYHTKAGRSVYFTPVSDLVSALAKAERGGTLREKIRFFCCFSLLIVEMPNLLLVNPNISGLVTTILAREARLLAGQRAEDPGGIAFVRLGLDRMRCGDRLRRPWGACRCPPGLRRPRSLPPSDIVQTSDK